MAFFAGLGLLGALVAERPALAAGQAEPLLRPTPLVLKDGRIANVSIHEVPFAPGRAEITPAARAGLSALTQAVGTDCFLTAQVIGHIDSGEIAEQDSLSAHRLARSRADAVQASLIGGGLPAKAIASVWDWQFMVREARATLWIFQLTAGEDCEGHPQEDLVAEASPSQARQIPPGPSPADVPALTPLEPAPEQRAAEPAPAQETAAKPMEAPRQSIVSAMAPADPTAEQGIAETRPPEPERRAIAAAAATERAPATTQVEPPQPAREPAAVPPPAERTQAQTGVPKVTQPLPPATPETAATAEPATRTVAAVARAAAATPPRAPQPAGTDGGIETGPEGALVITFATNSSYFPPGTSSRLRRLLAEVDPGKRYELSVQVAVSGSRKVVGAKTAREAASYNQWLAERRLERVERWLHENANPDTLSIRPEYLADDESRRVVVRVVPAG
jgi:outer membrane protein OmpA-like peptidoglycan-associated protein